MKEESVLTENHIRNMLPNDKTGNDGPQKCIRQDGAHITEKVSLK